MSNFVRMETPNEHNYALAESGTDKKKLFSCQYCGLDFHHRGSLYNHLKGVHKVYKIGSNHIKCLEYDCNENFNKLFHLELHLSEKHCKVIERQKLNFESVEEFKKWKKIIEKETKSEYITYTPGRTSNGDHPAMYYKCSRSGVYRQKPAPGTRKRKLKSQGSKKFGAHCISRIVARINSLSGAVTVFFCKSHYGHDTEYTNVCVDAGEEEEQHCETVVEAVPETIEIDKMFYWKTEGEYVCVTT